MMGKDVFACLMRCRTNTRPVRVLSSVVIRTFPPCTDISLPHPSENKIHMRVQMQGVYLSFQDRRDDNYLPQSPKAMLGSLFIRKPIVPPDRIPGCSL